VNLPSRSWKGYREDKTETLNKSKKSLGYQSKDRISSNIPSNVRRKYSSSFSSVKRGFKNTIKLIGFIIFTAITVFPSFIYVYILTIPESKDVIDIVLLFAPNILLFQYIVPNLSYFGFWIFTVYKISKRRCKWWYHVILLIISSVNWWTLIRLIRVVSFLSRMFGGFL
jgi:hypothetical protein